MPAPRRTLILDSSTIHRFGHFYGQTKALRDHLRSQGEAVEVVVNTRLDDIAEEFGAHKLLNFPAWNDERHRGLTYAAHWAFGNLVSREGLRRCDVLDITDDDLLISHSQSPNELMSVAEWYGNHLSSKPRLFVCVHTTPSYYADDVDRPIATAILKRTLEAWRPLVEGGRVTLAATNRELAQYMAELGGLKVVVAPIIIDASGIRRHAASRGVDRLRLLFSGYHVEKGIALLVDVIRARSFDGVAFLLQVGHRGAAATVERNLGQREDVQVWAEPTDAATYERLIGSADAVLLPYDPGKYEMRMSGIFMEALAAGKPVAVTRDTVMGRQMVDLGLPGVLIEDHSRVALTEAIYRTRDEFDLRREIASRAMDRYQAGLTAQAYVERVMSSFCG